MNEKALQITVHILRIGIAAPLGYYLGEYLAWERFMLLLLYFGTYMVVSLLIEMLRKSIFPYPEEDDIEE
jgi:predicted MFS family arabinose efflux permease